MSNSQTCTHNVPRILQENQSLEEILSVSEVKYIKPVIGMRSRGTGGVAVSKCYTKNISLYFSNKKNLKAKIFDLRLVMRAKIWLFSFNFWHRNCHQIVHISISNFQKVLTTEYARAFLYHNTKTKFVIYLTKHFQEQKLSSDTFEF